MRLIRLVGQALAGAALVAGVAAYGAGYEAVPPAHLAPAGDADTSAGIRFLEARVAADALDFVARNRLAGLYLTRLRDGGRHDDLERARQLVEQSLEHFPASVNPGALLLLARVDFGVHAFGRAAGHAREALPLLRDPTPALVVMGDALLELGDYESAGQVYARLNALAPDGAADRLTLNTRQARFAWLHGDTDTAAAHMEAAVSAAQALAEANLLAWCLWQSAVMTLAAARHETSERYLRAALATRHGYPPALATLAELRAAQGHHRRAIELYRLAIEAHPTIPALAALGDLHTLAGNEQAARRAYGEAEALAFAHTHAGPGGPRTADPGGPRTAAPADPGHHTRDLARFLADRGQQPARAHVLAMREFARRQDVYTADVLAWSALRAGAIDAAQAAVRSAMRLGTPDARLYFRAGHVALAQGDGQRAIGLLERALEINPTFDVLQAPTARHLLAELRATGGPAHSQRRTRAQ